MPEEKTLQFYNAIKSVRPNIVDFNTFKNGLNDENNLKQTYDFLKSNRPNIIGYDEFKSNILPELQMHQINTAVDTIYKGINLNLQNQVQPPQLWSTMPPTPEPTVAEPISKIIQELPTLEISQNLNNNSNVNQFNEDIEKLANKYEMHRKGIIFILSGLTQTNRVKMDTIKKVNKYFADDIENIVRKYNLDKSSLENNVNIDLDKLQLTVAEPSSTEVAIPEMKRGGAGGSYAETEAEKFLREQGKVPIMHAESPLKYLDKFFPKNPPQEKINDIFNQIPTIANLGLSDETKKAVYGGIRWAFETSKEFTSPPNVALILGTGALGKIAEVPPIISRIVSGLFSVDIGRRLPEQYDNFIKAIKSGNKEDIVNSTLHLATGVGLTTLTGLHAGLGKGEVPIKEEIKPKEVSIETPEQKVSLAEQTKGLPTIEEVSFKEPKGKPISEVEEDKIYYHQTSKTIAKKISKEGFSIDYPKARETDDRLPNGVYLKTSDKDIMVGGVGKEETTQIPVMLSPGKTLTVDTISDLHRILSDEYHNILKESINFDLKTAREFDNIWYGKFTDKELQELADKYGIDIDKIETFKNGEKDIEGAIYDKILRDSEPKVKALATKARELATKELVSMGYDYIYIKEDFGFMGRKTDNLIVLPHKIKEISQFPTGITPTITEKTPGGEIKTEPTVIPPEPITPKLETPKEKEAWQMTKEEWRKQGEYQAFNENSEYNKKSNEFIEYIKNITKGKRYAKGGIIESKEYDLDINGILYKEKDFTKEQLIKIKDFEKSKELIIKKYHLDNHKILIQQAIQEGKPVPSEVLADYPDLQAKLETETPKVQPAEKEAWEMTKEELSSKISINELNNIEKNINPEKYNWYKKRPYMDSDVRIKDFHKEAVKQAISEGKIPPDNVLADYPDLQAKVKTKTKIIKEKPLDKYLNEQIDYGGEIKTRGEVIKEMQDKGIEQKNIDAYMMGQKAIEQPTETGQTSIGGELGKAISESVKGLNEIAKDLPLGLSLRDVTKESGYKKARPHFEKAWESYKKAGIGIETFIRDMAKAMSERLLPYLRQFEQEIRKEQSIKIPSQSEKIAVKENVKVPEETKIVPQEIYDNAIKNQKKKSIFDIIISKNKSSNYRKTFLKDIFVPISTRLEQINPILKSKLREYIYNLEKQKQKDYQGIEIFLKSIDKIKSDDRIIFELASRNSDNIKLNEIFKKYGIEDEYKQFRKVFDDIINRAKDVGYDVGYLKDYFPRVIKDREGLLQYLYETDDWGIISENIKIKEKELGRKLSMEEQSYIADNVIRGYGSRKIMLSKPSNLKGRKIAVIDDILNKFYFDTPVSTMIYIERINNAIEARKFFGKGKEKPRTPNQLEKSQQQELLLSEDMNTIDLENSIGDYVADLVDKGTIKKSQENELISLLRSKFGYRHMRGSIASFKNTLYMTTLSNLDNVITQFGDLAWSFYNTGIPLTFKHLGRAVIGKSIIKKEDIGIHNIATEFSSFNRMGKALEFTFKIIGFDKVDRLGKESLINATIEKYQRMTQKDKINPLFRKKLENIFGDKTDEVINDLKNKKITENVKLLAFNTLLDFQPVSLSEMPKMYLDSPNGRILYMLKTFTIKQFDVFRREAFSRIKNGKTSKERAIGVKNLLKLAGIFVLCNATADEIKNILFGRDETISDRVLDNMLRLLGLSRYLTYNIQKKGIGSTINDLVSIPYNIVEYPYKDIKKAITNYKDFSIRDLETWRNVPFFGKTYYYWFGKGKEYKLIEEQKRETQDFNKYYELEKKLLARKNDKMTSKEKKKIKKRFKEIKKGK